jgi:hypothetical protein
VFLKVERSILDATTFSSQNKTVDAECYIVIFMLSYFAEFHQVECRYAECYAFIVMLSFNMLSVVITSAIMPSVVYAECYAEF